LSCIVLTLILPIKKKINNEKRMKIICLEKELDKDNGSLEMLYKVNNPKKINEETIR
tara:strand:- start:822 stop:992 length:171 start_codon:yes stop_codon:yes gene_type:complete